MTLPGLTKARSMGPVADAVEQAGGNVARVFSNTDLPLKLIDQPERLIPLRDQLVLLEYAAREIGDPALPARLSLQAGVSGLGAYGDYILAATHLEAALGRASLTMGSLLQSSTSMQFFVRNGMAHWCYVVTERCDVGRQKNEILALGYMMDLTRRFLGRTWVPQQAILSGSVLQSRTQVEAALSTDLSLGAVAGLVFPAEELAAANPNRSTCSAGECPQEPIVDDLVDCVEHLIGLSLLAGRPLIDWVAARVGMSRRSFQRRLSERGLTFEMVLRTVLEREAECLLADPGCSISHTAYELGYADAAHFSRAFVSWKGMSPRTWRAAAHELKNGS
jgi:AraC-like DNA-binding protein